MGISFYTLQAVAYLVDINHGKLKPDDNIFKFMLFMSFFPQIIQGPIARHDQLAAQLYEGHAFDYTRVTHGFQLILWGAVKKLIIADRLLIPVATVFENYSNYEGGILLFGAALYGLQVYTDFSGGMDIAQGIAQIFGIQLEINFRQPYFSVSIEDFWRRWHITLGGWMRDYIFFPLSLSKRFATISRNSRKVFGPFVGKRLPAILSSFVVYFLVGFWHGAEWKYILYGVYNGVIICSSLLLVEVYQKLKAFFRIDESAASWKVFQMVRTFYLVSIGRFFSRAINWRAAFGMIRRTTHHWYSLAFLVDGSLLELGLNNANWILLLFALALLFAVDIAHEKGIKIRETISMQPLVFRWIIYIAAVLIVLTFGVYGPEYVSGSFIYGQF